MTTDHQRGIVSALVANLQKTMTQAIDAGRVPEEWDGFELRWWLAELARENSIYPLGGSKRRRRRAFVNARRCRNL